MPGDLEKLGQQLDKIHDAEAAEKAKYAQQLKDGENMGNGMRAGAELVSCIGAGAFIGWLLDGWLETKPVFLIIFLLLGVFTAFYNVWRTTQNISPGTPFSRLQNGKKMGTTSADEKPNKNA